MKAWVHQAHGLTQANEGRGPPSHTLDLRSKICYEVDVNSDVSLDTE